ncbi:MAG: hypothetical protein EOM40_08060 [Clostridia bacterium]|nr:hypothetical protein [Clostridia bacterium]
MKKRKTIMSCILTVVLVFQMIATPSFAGSGQVIAKAADNTEGICKHHNEHTAECEYVKAVEGVPCDKECIDTDGDGAINHAEDCGYVMTIEGHACGYICEICNQPETELILQNESETLKVDEQENEIIIDSSCTCTTKCVEDSVNIDCPVCGAAGADLALCTGTAATPTNVPEAASLTGAQQAFVDAVAVLDKDLLLALAAAYVADPRSGGDAEAAFYAAYDKVEGFATSAGELYEALPPEQQTNETVAASYAALQSIRDEVNALLNAPPQPENGINNFEATQPAKGDGTSVEKAFEITSANELLWFAQQVNDGRTTICAKLMNDIDLSAVCGANVSGGTSWTAIGGYEHEYSGTFDGQGYKITNLYINNGGRRQGLFGSTESGAVIKLVTISGSVAVDFSSYAGGVCGYNHGSIANCTSEVSVAGYTYVGGIAGINYGSITNCHATGTVVGDSQFGPIEGSGSSSYPISNCYYLGTKETDDLTGTTYKTADQFKSGEVAWLLNSTSTNGTPNQDNKYPEGSGALTGTLVWRQNLSGTADTYPTLDSSHGTVYAVQAGYSNTEEYLITYDPGSSTGGAVPPQGSKIQDVAFTVDTTLPLTRDGYVQTGWTLTEENLMGVGAVEQLTADEAATLYPVWRKTYAVTVTNGTGSGNYKEGDPVTISANPPDTEMRFKEWTGADDLTFTSGDKYHATAVFSMPSREVSVTATYEPIPTLPGITTQPTDQTVTEGQPATFTVAATGDPAPSYQWQVNDGTGWQNIGSATSASYRIDAAALTSNSYRYRCYISNVAGNITSNEVTLAVKPGTSSYTLSIPSEIPLHEEQSSDISVNNILMSILDAEKTLKVSVSGENATLGADGYLILSTADKSCEAKTLIMDKNEDPVSNGEIILTAMEGQTDSNKLNFATPVKAEGSGSVQAGEYSGTLVFKVVIE